MNTAEHALIGAMLRESILVDEIDDLVADDFSVESYRLAYQVMQTMTVSGQVIDIITLADEMQRVGHQGNWIAIFGQAMRDCVSTANAKAYAKLVREESQKRNAMRIAQTLMSDVVISTDAIDQAVRDLMALSVTRRNYENNISQILSRAVDVIQERFENSDKGVIGVPSGLIELDNILSGFHKSDLYVIGARPSIGKTSFLINLANNAHTMCGIISAEQPAEQIGIRLIAINGRVCSHSMRTGKIDDGEFQKITSASANLQKRNDILIFDKPAPSIVDLVRQARKWKQQNNIKILFVDYIQRIRWTDLKIARHEQVGNVVMSLKELARDLDIPVVALAQVNRDVEKRNDKRPNMGDLANSSEIEKEADCIMMLYRDEVYDIDTQHKGIIEVDVVKNRHGPTGFKKFVWQEKFMRVENYAHSSVYEE